MRFDLSLGDSSSKKSSYFRFLEIGNPGEKDSQKIIFNCHWKNGTYFSFIHTTYSFQFFWWHSTTTLSSLSETKLKGYGGGTFSGKGFG